MARDDLQVNFRVPADLKAKLEAAASNAKRSITAELVARLEASFEQASQEALVEKIKREFFDDLRKTLAEGNLYLSDRAFDQAKKSEQKRVRKKS